MLYLIGFMSRSEVLLKLANIPSALYQRWTDWRPGYCEGNGGIRRAEGLSSKDRGLEHKVSEFNLYCQRRWHSVVCGYRSSSWYEVESGCDKFWFVGLDDDGMFNWDKISHRFVISTRCMCSPHGLFIVNMKWSFCLSCSHVFIPVVL